MNPELEEKTNYLNSLSSLNNELIDKFTCCICLNLVTEPTVVPCCGQILCSKCLQDWLSTSNTSTCPYCRQPITDKKGIPIKWAEKIKKILQIPHKSCPTHHKVFEFYCKDCNLFLCSECLFEELNPSTAKHRSHEIKKFSEMLYDIQIQIQKELPKILPKIEMAENILLTVRSYNQTLVLAKDSIISDMNKKFNYIKTTTESEYKEYQKNINSTFDKIIKAKEKVDNEIEFIQNKIESNTPLSSNSYQQHVDEINMVKKEMPTSEQLMFKPISNDFIIPYYNFSIYIPKFKEKNEQYKKLPPDAVHFFYSQKKKLCGNSWRIKIYPDGNLNGKGTHLSVFLELLRGPNVPSTYSYRLLIKNLYSSSDISREYSSLFAETDSWGWNKAALLETIFNGQYLDQEGGLTIYFSIRPENYYQINYDYEQAIKRKREKCAKLRKFLEEYGNSQNDHDELSDDSLSINEDDNN